MESALGIGNTPPKLEPDRDVMIVRTGNSDDTDFYFVVIPALLSFVRFPWYHMDNGLLHRREVETVLDVKRLNTYS